MTIYFANEGVIDLDTIRVMGVSVKTNDNPIGYFGTGLKFAIATLLRTGHKIELTAGDQRLEFTKKRKMIRGEEFDVVMMGDEMLPFTTELGKNWEVWQAYRELHANTLDEHGEVTNKKIHADTVISVDGVGIENEFRDRGRIFLQSEPIDIAGGVEIHHGRTRTIYYRGVRAGMLPEAANFTYNIIVEMALSEDRLFRSLWDVEWKIQQAIPVSTNSDIAAEILRSKNAWDSNLDFSFCHAPSKEFLAVAEQFKSDASTNQSAQRLLGKEQQRDGSFPPCKLSKREINQLIKAIKLISLLDCTVELEDIAICETLGVSVYGLYHKSKDQMFVARAALEMGTDFLAATIYEEWLHKEHKFEDESRDLQNFLFQKLISSVKKRS